MRSTSAARDEYRLTEADEDQMQDAIARWFAHQARQLRHSGRPAVIRLSADERVALRRVAAHAIGCSLDDLRDSEVQWIDNEIGEHEMGMR